MSEERKLLEDVREVLDWYAWRNNDGAPLNTPARLVARIDRCLATGGWMPIETAPKDRKTPVLITGGKFYWEGSVSTESAPMTHLEIAHWNGDFYDDGGEAQFWYQPTHWQPLPSPPKESDREWNQAGDVCKRYRRDGKPSSVRFD